MTHIQTSTSVCFLHKLNRSPDDWHTQTHLNLRHCISQLTWLVLLPSLSEFLFDVCPSSSSQRSWKEGWRWPTILFSVTPRPSSGGTSWTKAPIPQCFSRWTHLTVNVRKIIIMWYFWVLLCQLCSAGYLLLTCVCVSRWEVRPGMC